MRFVKRYARAVLAATCLLTAAALLHSHALFATRAAVQTDAARVREEAYRANNLGVALLEQFKPKDAAEQFRRALRLDPKLSLPRINLAVALFNVPDVDAARTEAEAAAAASPDAPQPQYILGLIAKQQGRAEDALASFARVLKIDPRDVGANVQTGQLLSQQRKYEEATAAYRIALEEEPYNGTALYNLGTVLLRAGRREEGQAVLQRFQALRASGAATVIGQNYLEQGRYAEAVSSTGAEPDVVDKRPPEVVFKDVTEAVLPHANANGGGWPVKSRYLDQSSGAIVLFDFDGDGQLDLLEVAGGRQRLYHNEGGRFADVTAQSGALAKESDAVATVAVAGDYDNDGRADLFILRYGAPALYHNEGGGRFTDATAAAKIPKYAYLSKSAAFVDCDHDGDLDIFVAGMSDPTSALEFEENVKKHPPNYLFTITHMLPPAPNLLLRNNGDGTFTDQTAASGLTDGRNYFEPGSQPWLKSSPEPKSNSFKTSRGQFAVVPTDFDNRRDVDLFTVANAGLTLWRNMRDGTFRDVSAEVGIGGEEFRMSTSVTAGDVNKDGFTDFYIGGGNTFVLSDGRGRFRVKLGPTRPADTPTEKGSYGAYNNASLLLDYDNDGLLDLLTAVTKSDANNGTHMELRVWRNVGDGWVDVSDKAARGVKAEIGAIGTPLSRSRMLAAGDLDGDGDTDIVFGVPGGGLRVLRNEGGNRNRSLRVSLAGKASNRGGIGVKVEVRAGSLQEKLETYAAAPAPAPADILFGLGRRESADAVRVLWPSGVVQAETESPATSVGNETATGVRRGSLRVTELDRKPSSCPYLYTWNGARFEFITDFMGGGEMGDWVAPGLFNTPDPDEYVRIRGDQLRERGGRYELRVTNELEEALFVDRLQLVAVSHPSDVEVYPNEGLGNPTGPDFKLYATRGARPPRTAIDERGRDVLARLTRLDRKYVDDFPLLGVRGYAAEHTLTLDLGKDEGGRMKDERRADGNADSSFRLHPSSFILLLTGWTDYAFSSNNVAASQRGMEMKPPSLQVRDAAGEWRTVIESIGFPVGRPQTVTVDLTGKFLSASREVRIVTNMRVYWDQALVADSGGELPFKVERLEASDATLRDRGFSAEVTPDGREPFSYDYARVSLASPWKMFTGRYTRLGDVREVLLKTDDMFVVSKPGDELALSFDAAALQPLPAGWTRTFLLYADGFSKEMDINSASPHEVAPMPFHGMKRYPYGAPESYPTDEAHQNYLERYNTRVVVATLPQLWGGGR
jgi:hypothetical protein